MTYTSHYRPIRSGSRIRLVVHDGSLSGSLVGYFYGWFVLALGCTSRTLTISDEMVTAVEVEW